MKPDAIDSMLQVIGQVRKTFPFEQSETQICADSCKGCHK